MEPAARRAGMTMGKAIIMGLTAEGGLAGGGMCMIVLHGDLDSVSQCAAHSLCNGSL